jgi:hypothetical protein
LFFVGWSYERKKTERDVGIVQLSYILHFEANIVQGGNKYTFFRKENSIRRYGNGDCGYILEEMSNS